jgi:hypothetical protein
MRVFWNERYGREEYVYGELPNEFFKAQLQGLTPGKILLPAEGEGRNAVYGASLGWDVYAFDQSEAGKVKALALGRKANVKFQYDVIDVLEVSFPPDTFDAMAMIFAHFPGEIRTSSFKKLLPLLKSGGVLLFEAFSKKQLQYQASNPAAGGPRDISMLYDQDLLREEMPEIIFNQLEEREVWLDEGPFHSGAGMVIRATGKKI